MCLGFANGFGFNVGKPQFLVKEKEYFNAGSCFLVWLIYNSTLSSSKIETRGTRKLRNSYHICLYNDRRKWTPFECIFWSCVCRMFGHSQPTMNIFSEGSRLKNHYRYSPQQIRNNFGVSACVSEKMLGCLAKVTRPFAGGSITLPKFISMPTNEKERWCDVCLLSNAKQEFSGLTPFITNAIRLACLLSVWNRAYFFFLCSAYVQYGKLYACMHKNIPLGFLCWYTDGVTLLRERNNIYNIRAFSGIMKHTNSHTHTRTNTALKYTPNLHAPQKYAHGASYTKQYESNRSILCVPVCVQLFDRMRLYACAFAKCEEQISRRRRVKITMPMTKEMKLYFAWSWQHHRVWVCTGKAFKYTASTTTGEFRVAGRFPFLCGFFLFCVWGCEPESTATASTFLLHYNLPHSGAKPLMQTTAS